MDSRFYVLISVAFFSSLFIEISATKKVLVLGGNGFLGSSAVTLLLDEGYNVTVLNRGHRYYDSGRRIDPHVNEHFICDRDTFIRKSCKELLHSGKYDFVIDFSSYTPFQTEQMVDVLKGRVGLYIFISTDAVYEVSDKNHTGLTHEGDSKIRYSTSYKAKYAITNKYGEQKWDCEKVLEEQRAKHGFPYIILRLPEAIGPRDTTLRLWVYQLWIQLSHALNIPVSLPDMYKEQPFSLVYSLDVAKAIYYIIAELSDPSAIDRSFNLAFSEHITLSDLFGKIANYSNTSTPTYNHNNQRGWFNILSVDKGPLDISRAKFLLKWRPTSLQEALKATLKFNEEAMIDERYVKEREMMFGQFIDDVLIPSEFDDDELFTQALIDKYGTTVFDGIDIGLDVDITQPRLDSSSTSETSTMKEDLVTEHKDTKQDEEVDIQVCHKDKCS